MVCGDAIEEGMGTTGILSDVTSNRARALATRIGHVVEAVRGECIAEVEIDKARLHDRSHIVVVNFQDAIHAGKDHNDTTIERDCAATQACSCATGDDRNMIPSGKFDNLGDFVRIGWKDNDIWASAINGGVVFIECDIIWSVQDMRDA
jgi:hypothetical protein